MTAVPWHPGERPISSSQFVSQSHFPPAWLPKEPSPCSPCREAVPSPPPPGWASRTFKGPGSTVALEGAQPMRFYLFMVSPWDQNRKTKSIASCRSL